MYVRFLEGVRPRPSAQADMARSCLPYELFQSGAALYYGLNALSNNMILCDRKQLKSPNGLILGTPGSGKSFAAKREMTNAFLITDDDIIICDPEAEYFSLVQRLDGQVIRLSPTGGIVQNKEIMVE